MAGDCVLFNDVLHVEAAVTSHEEKHHEVREHQILVGLVVGVLV